jgi:hypothetical protein
LGFETWRQEGIEGVSYHTERVINLQHAVMGDANSEPGGLGETDGPGDQAGLADTH